MITKMFLLLLTTLVFIKEVKPSNILVIHSYYSASHMLTLRKMGEHFAENGHQIHYLRWKEDYNPPYPHPNMTETTLSIDNSDGSIPFTTKGKEAGVDVSLILN
jgi:hypothetical protein